MNKIQFVRTLTVGLTLTVTSFEPVKADAPPVTAPQPLPSLAKESERLTAAIMETFWDKTSRIFRAPVLSAETVPSDPEHDRGETLWPSLLGLHALVEGEKAHPGRYCAQIATVFDGLQQYYSPDIQAYTAWMHFPGNNDAYYDDNAWVVIIFTEAALACQKTDPKRSAQYLKSAQTVMDAFLIKGYDFSDKPGGMRWGTDPTKPNTADRGTSSTAGAALAALMMARAGVNVEENTKFGHRLLTWLTTRVLDRDSLVGDALIPPDWTPRQIKWTYNTGVPMRAYIEHYRLTKDTESLKTAEKLARAALDTSGALFDRKVNDPAKRQYWDGTYFVHYLVDGLLQVAQETSDEKLAAEARAMSHRSALFTQTFLKDPQDGFYWRNMRLYTIDEDHLAQWEKWTGQKIAPEFDESERSKEAQFASVPVRDRPLVKTLLASGGAARLFWMVGGVKTSK